MSHLVLLGDSIFDNGAYVQDTGPAVISQVRQKLPPGWEASLCAVDGDRIDNVAKQLKAMPPGATHLAISIGGNDVLDQVPILFDSARSFAQVLETLAQKSGHFQEKYRRMLDSVLQRNLPTMICTVYEGRMAQPEIQRIAATALKVFNDVILREAIARSLPVLDLRLVCSRPEDYANEIEPSSVGGDKIAEQIVRIMTTHDFSGASRQFYS